MTPMVARSVVLHPGVLACAYFHTSAHFIRHLGRERLIESDVTDPHFIAVRRKPHNRDLGTSAGYSSTVDGRTFTFKPPDSSSFFTSS